MGLFGDNSYKFGLFSANCGGGLTFSAAPERWPADWDDVVVVSRMADAAGIEFILPVAKWRGIGEADNFGRSFETLTHSAAIGALTKRIGIFTTVHVTLLSPAFVAKAMATLDHVTHGRAGLNIVCGWNQDEFSLHGVTIDVERRYDQGLEWFRIYARLMEGGPPFDWDGEFYELQGLVTNPVSIQRPRPPVMSAGFSEKGRAFAAEAADILFSTLPDLDQARDFVAGVHANAARLGRKVDVYSTTQIVCRPTRREAEDFYYYFAEEQADETALAYFRRERLRTAGKDTATTQRPMERAKTDRFARATGKAYAGLFPGTYPVVGTPDEVVEELARISATGIAGSALVFLNYLEEMPYFIEAVLPRMERAGLRKPFGTAQS
jgi:alkanesulfonate monooxygenase SsuD/methylene tetrahydromethanopterin reductase-like flavin-dependent oxidoreductase (luciferase family)